MSATSPLTTRAAQSVVRPLPCLVVPRDEVDHWIDLDAATWTRCNEVALAVGRAIQRAFDPPRIGTVVAGFEVPHTHLHVLQLHDMGGLDFANADPDPDPDEMDRAADAIRAALRQLGHDDHVS
jgi:diadenosine tetraphosphate (Ap4A) HIT family hydrolase